MFQPNTAPAVFNAVFANAKEVKFDPAWKNNTGYMDGAVSADLGLVQGETRSFTDDHGRRGVIVGTKVGNVVLFERYTDNRTVIVFNAPIEVQKHVAELGFYFKSDEVLYLLNFFDSKNGICTPQDGQNIGQWF